MANKKLVIIPTEQVELFRQQTIRHKGEDIAIRGAKLRRDAPSNRVYLWLILLAGIAGGLLIIVIIIHLFVQASSV